MWRKTTKSTPGIAMQPRRGQSDPSVFPAVHRGRSICKDQATKIAIGSLHERNQSKREAADRINNPGAARRKPKATPLMQIKWSLHIMRINIGSKPNEIHSWTKARSDARNWERGGARSDKKQSKGA
jgi:hypothetical protein